MLFDPVSIGNALHLRSRIVMAPLYLVIDGRSDAFRAFYVRRAQGGVGLAIAPQSTPGGLDDWADESADLGVAFQPLIEGCHAKADLVALGRQLIADPDWPVKLYEGRDKEIVPCLWENAGCVRDSFYKRKPTRCIQNPEAGLEYLAQG